jgi:hypothetical protein
MGGDAIERRWQGRTLETAQILRDWSLKALLLLPVRRLNQVDQGCD